MRATVTGEIGSIKASGDGRYLDINILQPGNTVRVWCSADFDGVSTLKKGDQITADVFIRPRIGKAVLRGERPLTETSAYLSCSLDGFQLVTVAGEKLHKVS